MKLPFFKRPSRKKQAPTETRFLSVDVGSDSVKSVLFEVTKDFSNKNSLKIIGFGKHLLNLKDVQAGVIANKEGVEEALIASINESLLNVADEVKDIVFGLSGEMSLGFSTTVRVTREKPEEEITEKEILSIKARIEEVSFIQAQKEYARLKGLGDIDLELINSEITNFKVDGFYVAEPITFKGKVVEVTLFAAFAPSNHLSVIQNLSSSLGLNLITVSSNMYALIKNLASREPSEFDGLVVDMGGDSTDVAVVFGGGILSTRTVSVGGRSFTRKIAANLDLPFSDAEAKKLGYSEGKLQEDELTKVGSIIDETAASWLNALEITLIDVDGVKTFPSKLYLTGGSSYITGLDELLEEEEWRKRVPMKQHLKVKRISLEDFSFISNPQAFMKQKEVIVPASLGVLGLMALDLYE